MGKSGYMTTPSAAWLEEKPLGFTFSLIPTEYSEGVIYSPSISTDESILNIYSIRVALTSFMEVNLSIAYRPQISDKIGVGERHLDFRFRLLNESKYLPVLVLGFTPPGSVAPYISHDYLVATKNFKTSLGDFSASLGYGSPYILVRKEGGNFLELLLNKKQDFQGVKYLTGFYGAASYMPVDFAGLMLEYDTQTFNTGFFVKYKDWLYFQAYTFEGKELAFTTSINLSLDFSPNTLRKYEKELD